jgi:ubiquinone/menaquinone biosynthesis C-methylase UbiE
MATAAQGPNDTYTHGHHDSVLRSHRNRTVENSAAYLIPFLKPGARLLDVGCGPGTITVDFAERIAPGEVVAIEREQAVVGEASALATERKLSNVTIELGDVYGLTYDDDSFDVVHAHQVLQHLSDPVAALREMRRVAKPGGVVAARDADYAGMTWHPRDERLDRWMEVYQGVARSNDAEPNAARWLLGWANQVGFSSVTITGSMWCYADEATRDWWGSLWATRVTASSLAEQAIAKDIATADELEDIAAAFQAWSNHPDAYFTVPHGELLATP